MSGAGSDRDARFRGRRADGFYGYAQLRRYPGDAGGGSIRWRRRSRVDEERVPFARRVALPRTGQRVFVFQNQVFKLNEPDTITVTPLQLSAAYRFVGQTPNAVTRPRFTPYAGGGIGWYRFSETSPHSSSDEDETTTHTGYHVLAGVETPLRKWMAAAVDAQWALVPNAFGDSATSVASLYDEHDLGGFTLTFRIILGQ